MLPKREGSAPRRLVTDKARSHLFASVHGIAQSLFRNEGEQCALVAS